MPYRNGVSPRSAGKGGQPRHYSYNNNNNNNNRGNPSSCCESYSALTNSTLTNWISRSSFSFRKSSSSIESNYAIKNWTMSVRDTEYEQQARMDFSNNNNRSSRSRPSSVLNNNYRTISTLSSNVDFQQKTEDKSMRVSKQF